MRKQVVFAGVVALQFGMGVQSAAATPGALTPAQASASCSAYFGVGAGPEALSACLWDMRAIHAGAAGATGAGVKVGVIDGGMLYEVDVMTDRAWRCTARRCSSSRSPSSAVSSLMRSRFLLVWLTDHVSAASKRAPLRQLRALCPQLARFSESGGNAYGLQHATGG